MIKYIENIDELKNYKNSKNKVAITQSMIQKKIYKLILYTMG